MSSSSPFYTPTHIYFSSCDFFFCTYLWIIGYRKVTKKALYTMSNILWVVVLFSYRHSSAYCIQRESSYNGRIYAENYIEFDVCIHQEWIIRYFVVFFLRFLTSKSERKIIHFTIGSYLTIIFGCFLGNSIDYNNIYK